MDKKLTDNEIIKALECCADSTIMSCAEKGCPFRKFCQEDTNALEKASLDLLNRKDAEIERLKKGETLSKSGFWNLLCGALVFTKTLEEYNEFRRTIKSEAIKEFAERLKCNASILCDKVTGLPCSYTISAYNFNRLVKEMTGQNDLKEG